MTSRSLILGPDSGPQAPWPLRMSGRVISGFGRGSKELGIPTANLPVNTTTTPWIATIPSGVYFGWASLALPSTHPDHSCHDSEPPRSFQIHPMVMSIGYNPFYKNAVRSAEVHVLRIFGADFYGVPMRLLLCGFIREERDYNSLKELIEDINTDCEVARRSLARVGWTPKEFGTGGSLDGSWLVREEGEEEGEKKAEEEKKGQ